MKPNPPDDSINQRVIALSKDPDLIKKITESYAPSLYGLTDIKLAILYHLVGGVAKERSGLTSRGAIHILLIGDPGTGKTQLLQYAETLSEAVSVTGTGVNIDGLSAMITLDQKGTPTIIEGVLVKADQKYLHIDKLDKMTHELQTILETAMENQFYPIAKNGVHTCLNTRVSILATANPTLGRYNPYQTLAQNINFPVGLLSCFDLIFIIRDHSDNLKDRVIAEKILEMEETEPNDNIINHTLLSTYITEASKVEPILSQEAKTLLRDFYLDIRRATDAGHAISITPRQLLSLVRLTEARAKLHLRETVSESDVEAAIRIFSESLEQVGIDPITHRYDIDVLYTGRPTVLNSKLLKVVEVFSELEKISARVSEADLHNMLFEKYGMNRRTVARLLRTLVKEDIITSKAPGYYMRNGLSG